MKKKPEPKALFIERMQKLFGNEKEYQKYLEILKKEPVRSIRVNTIKIDPKKLREKLEKNGWNIKQPFKNHEEILIVTSELEPGELGRSLEHLLGYYYIQELASMLPVIALQPKENEVVLDLCASPGSKTTQIATFMNNTGTILANEINLRRIKILAANLERCGVSNTFITRKDGFALCNRLRKEGIKVDKILVDAPCSGEGTLRSSPKTYIMWSINTIKKLSKVQKNLAKAAFEILKKGGEMVYSTCTHAPEENEEIIDFMVNHFKSEIEVEKIHLPLIPKPGIKKWEEKEYAEEVKYGCRIYPHDNNTEGFFITKFKKK